MATTDLKHKALVKQITVSMILHNVCMVRKDLADFDDTDVDWQEYYSDPNQNIMMCPTCVRHAKLHCPHAAWNKQTPVLNKGSSCHELRTRMCDMLWDRLVQNGEEGSVHDIMETRNEAVRKINDLKRARVLAAASQ